ncbi:MAG TPA: Rrf2 family transcriptional regulator [Firmicutes bacterium]|nr:Rrf2 family transcriptional regulator [Bacillota bacterium]
MQITRQSEYAIRTIIELANAAKGELLTTKTISQHQEIPEVFLKKTIQLLTNAGLITTQRGTQGGVRLAVPATGITIADIITAVEGKLAINVCLSAAYECPNKPVCRVREILGRAQAAMLAELSRESIADLVNLRAKKC